MKTTLSSLCHGMMAFVFLLLLGKTAAIAASPYEDKECNYKNLFTVKAKVSHNSSLCTKKNEAEPHYFTDISALIISSKVKDALLKQGNFETGEAFHADIQNKTLSLDIPLVSAFTHEVFGTDFENPDIDNFYLLLSVGHKTYNSSGSSQTILNEEFSNPKQWNLLDNISIPVNGFLAISPSRPVLIKLTDLLSCKLTSQSDNPACEQIEISIETKCKLAINKQTTIYTGYPYRISLSAEAKCSTNTFTATPEEYNAARNFTYASGIFHWKYTHGEADTYLPLANRGNTLTLTPIEHPTMPIGKNILVRVIDGRASNTENTQVICFYPDLPQPTKTKFQRIPEGSTKLNFLQLTFNRNFNKDLDETPTLLTIYSKIAQKSDGSIIPGESTIIFQEAFNMSKFSGTDYITSVANCNMKEGTYYVTVEGTVRNQSNSPGKNGTLPDNIKNAMFKVVPISVGSNDFEVEKVEFTPPACFGGKGKAKVTLNEYFIPLVSKYPVFYYLKNPGIKGTPVYDTINFRCTYTGTQANPHATFECDHIGPKHSTFTIVIPSLVSGSGIADKDRPGISKTSDKGTLPNDTYNNRISHFNISFSQPEPLHVPVEVKHLSGYYCANGTLAMADDGKVTVWRDRANGGTEPYKFFFRDDYLNPSQTPLNSDAIPAVHAGYRYITLQDKNACRFDTAVFVSNLNTELCAEIAVERNISCYNANDGILNVSLKKQSGNSLQFTWYKNGTLLSEENVPSLYNLGPGTYKVVVTDMTTGMSSFAQTNLIEPNQLKLSLQQKTDVDCFGASSGTIAVSGSGGTPSYLYLWNGISYGSLRRNLPAGEYKVKLIDHNSCETTQTYTITQPKAPFEIHIDSVIHAHYNTLEEFVPGKIIQHPQGGTMPYGLLKSGGADLNNLAPGTYSLQQYDAKQCMDEKEINIEVYDRMRISIAQDIHNQCFGESKAACHVLVEGGVSPFSILWSNGETQAYIQNLSAGNYSVRVQDAVGVVRTANIEITQPERLQIDSLYTQNPTYHGCTDSLCLPNESDGEIHFNVSGGTIPYSLYWKRNDTSIALYGNSKVEHLTAGNYLLETRDLNGCTAQRSFTLIDIDPLRIAGEIQQGINCHGDTSGMIKAKASGGTPPYRYAWENLPDSSELASNLSSGIYTALVYDALGVTAKTSLFLPQPGPLCIRVDSLIAPTYPGGKNGIVPERENNGRIHLSVDGGTPPYHFKWFKNEVAMKNDSPKLTELSDGLYHLHLMDDAGCTADTSFYFPRVEALIGSIAIESPVSCFGMSDAILSAGIRGGIAPYSIIWLENDTDTVGNEDLLPDGKSGKYTLYVSDSNRVESVYTLFLSQPDSLRVELAIENSLCHQDSTGKAVALVAGGTLPYQYRWTINGKDSDIADSAFYHLENADINLLVNDKRGCLAQSAALIRAPQPLQLEHLALNPSYQGSQWQQTENKKNNGKIELLASGGTPPYLYVWSNGADSRVLENLDSGIYRVTLADSNGCHMEQEIQLRRTPTLTTQLQLLNEPSCADSQTAAFKLFIQGGEAPYTFDWYKDDKWMGDDSILQKTAMGAGTYKIFIRDANGIASCDSLRVHEPERISVMAETEDATAWTVANGSIRLNISGGIPPYRIFWSNGAQTTSIEHLKRGLYKADIYDSMHCRTSASYRVNSPDSLMISSMAVQHYKEESHYGFIKLSVQGGIKPYRYQWKDAAGNLLLTDSGNRSLMEIANLMPGTYRFNLADAGGAIIEQVFAIEEHHKLEAALLLENPIYCYGENTAAVQAWIKGGKEPYTCIWHGIPDSLQSLATNNTDPTRLENLPAGEYSLYVYDAYHDSCSVSISVTQASPLSVSAEIYPSEDTSTADGVFVLRVQGGHPPYHYLWNTGNEQNLQAFLRESSYQATITDAEGCTTSIDLDSVMSRNLQLRLRQTTGIQCFGNQTAAVEMDILNGKPPFVIQWSNGSNKQNIKGIPAGMYTVSVTDVFGRTDSGSIMIRQPEKLRQHIEIREPSCFGFADGSIRLKTSGGNGFYNYSWNTGENTPNRFQLVQGTYIVRVTDRLQCSRTDTITLKHPERLQCILQIDSILCPDEKGRIAWNAEGGTPPYKHQWILQNLRESAQNPNAGEIPLIELAEAGLYTLSIIDNNRCRLDTSILLENPKAPAYSLERERSLCAGQTISLKAEGCDTLANLQYLWIYPDGKTSGKMEISTDIPGLHQLTLIQKNQCIYRDSVNVSPFPDSIHAEFWVSSQITAHQSCLLVDLSEYTPDSIAWHIPENVKILNREGSYLEIQFPGAGLYTVGMTSFKGLCYESVFRQIEVFDEQEKSHKETERHSVRWSVSPNPTQSNCLLSAESDRSLSVRYRLVRASNGKVLFQGTFALPKNTRISRSVFSGNESAGLYILILEYGNKRHSVKIVKL